MVTRYILMPAVITGMAICCQAHASMDVDQEASSRVKEMIIDLGGHGSAEFNDKVIPCSYRGSKKVSIVRSGDTTTYTGEYRNCRENGTIRDGIYTVVTAGEYVFDSSSQRSKNGELFDAVIAGDAGKVRKLIKAKADVNYTESIRNNDGTFVDEWSPLMSSAVAGNLEIMKLLVAGGAWVNYLNSRAANSLWLAANNGRLDMVKFLASKNAYINNLDVEDISPLMAAALNGHFNVAEYLVRLKADVNLRSRNGDNALMLAVQNGHTKIARLVIEAGSEINHRNRSGATALMMAVVEGNEEIVGLLLEKKADMTITSDSGKTAIDYATVKGNAVILEALKNAPR